MSFGAVYTQVFQIRDTFVEALRNAGRSLLQRNPRFVV